MSAPGSRIQQQVTQVDAEHREQCLRTPVDIRPESGPPGVGPGGHAGARSPRPGERKTSWGRRAAGGPDLPAVSCLAASAVVRAATVCRCRSGAVRLQGTGATSGSARSGMRLEVLGQFAAGPRPAPWRDGLTYRSSTGTSSSGARAIRRGRRLQDDVRVVPPRPNGTHRGPAGSIRRGRPRPGRPVEDEDAGREPRRARVRPRSPGQRRDPPGTQREDRLDQASHARGRVQGGRCSP